MRHTELALKLEGGRLMGRLKPAGISEFDRQLERFHSVNTLLHMRVAVAVADDPRRKLKVHGS